MSLTNTVASLTNIIRGLIHDKLRIDGRDAREYTGNADFQLSEDFVDSTTIKVFLNGTQLDESDWSYDSDTNEVTVAPVTSGISLNTKDIILITYSYFKKYSDNEIKGYIESSLSYFVQYKYKKTFELSASTNQIITVNGINPTKDELYIIALIASILIDPQNIEINIPDLRLSANREKSDQDQIKEIFINFKKFVGKIDFHFIENLE